MTMIAETPAPARTFAAAIVFTALAAITLALAWLGATGEVPWRYNADHRAQIWWQYITLSVVALGAVGMVLVLGGRGKGRLPWPRTARAVGVGLVVISLLWGAAIFMFGLIGGDAVAAFVIAAASVAPALSVSLATVWVGFSSRRLGAMLIALGILVCGAIAMSFAFN
ncbi:hypothetical protein [Microbacterium sp. SSM24]|uniref:hypothetical protein n=1 Tax=Microbacterium sp. SSM24 TaxID=2991714 RepID=UPI002226A6F5|nr:hypothetical protein [Microbacterium sp. SSM24]MCW3492176.1 hypothetical protein [Microbacterium sp. SSM24]